MTKGSRRRFRMFCLDRKLSDQLIIRKFNDVHDSPHTRDLLSD